MYQTITKIHKIFDFFKDAPFEIWIVGGSIRDLLLCRESDDFDLAMSCESEKAEEYLLTRGIYLKNSNSKKFSAIHATIPEVGNIELTTIRSEGEYKDFRRPSSICIAKNIEEDLSRRDFTINAMAMDKEFRIIDPFDGKKDLHLMKIRCVGNPAKKMKEDSLRILRGIRFASHLNFEIEQETLHFMELNTHNIIKIPSFTASTELQKLIKCEHLKYTNILNTAYPEILWEKMLYMNYEQKLICLSEQPCIQMPSKIRRKAQKYNIKLPTVNERRQIVKWLMEINPENPFDIIHYHQITSDMDFSSLIVEIAHHDLLRLPIKTSELALTAQNLGMPGSVHTGNIMNQMLEAVRLGIIENKPEQLRKYIQEYYKTTAQTGENSEIL